MYAPSGTTSSRQASSIGMMPKGFTVRVFKGPAYPYSQVPSTKYGLEYQPIPLAEPRQSTSSQNWHSRLQITSNSAFAPGGHSTSSRSLTSTVPSNANLLSRYDSNSRPPPSYSIYQGSKDTYIYEPSLSSKADVYSNPEDDDVTTADYTPSSAFSPAMSTDSTTTLRGAITPEASLTDLRISTPVPASSRSSFPLNIPSLAQAQTAIKGIFRSQTPNNNPSSQAEGTTNPRTSGGRPTSIIGLSGATRSNTLIQAAATSGSGISLTAASSNARHSYTRPRSPVSETEDRELDSLARANTEYNAGRPKQASSYYSSVRDSILPAATSGAMGGGMGGATGQLYPNLPLRNSPEQHHASATTHSGNEWPHRNMPEAVGHSTADRQAQSEYLHTPAEAAYDASDQPIPPSRGRTVGSQEYNQPTTRAPSISGERLPPRTLIPRSQNDSSNPGRYVPISRTMTSSGQAGSPTEPTTEQDRQQDGLTSSMPALETRDTQRERRTSVSRNSSISSIPHSLMPRDMGGAVPNRGQEQRRRDSMSQQNSHVDHESSIREPLSLSTAPHQIHGSAVPATYAVDSASRYVTSNATRPTSSVLPQISGLRTSPQQLHRSPSVQQPAPHTVAPPTSSYVSSACTLQPNVSPPRVRHDSVASRTSGPPELSSVGVTSALTQNREHIQQDRRPYPPRRQSSTYEPQNPRLDGINNQRSSEYTSRVEPPERRTHGGFVAHHIRDSIYQANSVTDMNSQSGSVNSMPTDRTRYDNDRRSREIAPYEQAAPPPSTLSSDPGPEPGRRMSTFQSSSQYDRAENTSHIAPASTRDGPETSPLTHPSDRSRTPFPAPRRETQRRYSDGDTSAAGNSTYAPAYAPYPGAGFTMDEEAPELAPVEHQPQRRYSDGDHADPSTQDRTSLALFRTVRWNENLVCPSPVFAHQRRKGWYNRRGDQLWTNDGAYKPPPPGQEYPPDLDGYPEHREGWMNEQGVRIDMGHRLIPKVPLKSALKPSRARPPAQIDI